ncbi:uncharacterized protein G2W53_007196 [Senna tora]|uniref:Uncharacterized protein n=1 Tax=Senna tora TaxID=362788 RepID=A0A834X6P1_9FABA|nr:uncharacterized protein G2W53_007196 [Senna tora]
MDLSYCRITRSLIGPTSNLYITRARRTISASGIKK